MLGHGVEAQHHLISQGKQRAPLPLRLRHASGTAWSTARPHLLERCPLDDSGSHEPKMPR